MHSVRDTGYLLPCVRSATCVEGMFCICSGCIGSGTAGWAIASEAQSNLYIRYSVFPLSMSEHVLQASSTSRSPARAVVPAIIASSQQELDERIAQLRGLAHTLQLDVMDGSFVANKSLAFELTLPDKTQDVSFEAHLMVVDPVDWISRLAKWDAVVLVYIHLESGHTEEAIAAARSAGKRVGLAINPGTQANALASYIQSIDEVLVMTVNPGQYGSAFLPETLQKIKQVKSLCDIPVEVDGGISDVTIAKAQEAGADKFVVGSYVVRAKDRRAAFDALQRAA